jgi:protein-tyrosine phosphatase
MFTELFWIDGPWPGRLAISPRPRGADWLEEEMKAWRRAGIDAVVSLLTPEETADLSLVQEQLHSEANGIEFYSLPIADRSVPASYPDAAQLIAKLDAALSHGKKVTVHCRQGIGRAALIAAGLLIEQGFSPEEAIQRVSRARHAVTPETPEQRAWINSFAATLGQRK